MNFIRSPHILLYSCLLLVFLVGCDRGKENTVERKSRPVPVRTVRVVEKEISHVVHACGKTANTKQIRLSFKTSGIIRSIPFKEGETVDKGQFLAELDLTEISARVSQAEIAMAKAERDIERTKRLFADSVVTRENLFCVFRRQ